jgi:RNA polymerase sigma-70 factor (ECF subfamily)
MNNLISDPNFEKIVLSTQHPVLGRNNFSAPRGVFVRNEAMKTENDPTGDLAWIAGILQGKTQVFGAIYTRYYPKVFHRCLSVIRDHDEAKDMAQDILLKAFNHLSGYRGEASFSTWLYAITNNHCIEYYRRKNLRHFVGLEEAGRLDEIADMPDQEDASGDLAEVVMSSLRHLSSADREILEMRYEKDFSIRELQQRLRLSASAVKMRLMRARKKLNKEAVRRAGLLLTH